MLNIILTLDYEIHGNGDGCPQGLMIEPTNRLLRLCNEYGAKLTIMADVAEILKFKCYKEEYGRDDYYYDAIADQLRSAVKDGHDVQLHIHSSYFNSRNDNGCWVQDWSEYNFAGLPYERMDWMIKTCKQFLETLLSPVARDYRCIAFRAANWSVIPSSGVVKALVNNDIKIDTSVFKYGRRKGMVTFDYSRAYSSLLPWRVKEDDICSRDDAGYLWELPIYSENRWIGAFLTSSRIRRVFMSRQHKVRPRGSDNLQHGVTPAAPHNGKESWATAILQRHAWKADFNQCSSKQLISALQRASNRYDRPRDTPLPFILIGHSKLFTQRNERKFASFLAHCAKNSDKFTFDTLNGINNFIKQRET